MTLGLSGMRRGQNMGTRDMKLFLHRIMMALAAFGLFAAQAASAQVQQIDPDTAIDSDLAPQSGGVPAAQLPAPAPASNDPIAESPPYTGTGTVSSSIGPSLETVPPPVTTSAATSGATYREDDLIGAAEGVFGKGAKGLALMIQGILKKQGEPNAFITGREAGGAVVVGLRYGSGTLHHKIEGERAVYWTGPSLGFDLGANAANTFVLVYNLDDSQDLFRRYGAGEGQAYFVGGFNVSYLRRGNVVLIPVRLGAGLRLGINAGYMKFSETQKWMPF